MQHFNFSRLVNKYSKEITVIIPAQKELNNSGVWEKGEPKEVTLVGAVIRHRENKVYRSAGTLTANDSALYLLEEPNIDLIGAEVKNDNKIYKVESVLNNSEFTGIWAYNLKYVSAFKDGDGR